MTKKINYLIELLDYLVPLSCLLAVAFFTWKLDISNLSDNIESNVPVLSFLCVIAINILYQYKKLGEVKSLIEDPKNHVPFVEQIKGSEYEFEAMISRAKSSIFIVGPNLAFLSKKNQWKHFQTLLFNKLDNPNFKVHMLLMDRKNTEFCEFMKYAFTNSFTSELDKSTVIFNQWLDDAKEKHLDNLKIYITELVTISLLFIDAEEPNGRVLVSPIIRKTEGRNRPSFLIKKSDHKSAFDRYYEKYSEIFSEKDGDFKGRSINSAFDEMPTETKKVIHEYYMLKKEEGSQK